MFLFANKLQVLGDRSSGEITMKQWLLLIMVKNLRERDIVVGNEPEEITINKLADFMGYSRQNAKKTLALLEQKGYVRTEPCQTDKRSKVITLTPKSYQYFNEYEKMGDDFLDLVYDGMDDEEIMRLYTTFKKIWGNIENMMEKMK